MLIAAGGTLGAQLIQSLHAKLCTRAACFNALADPDLFLRQQLVGAFLIKRLFMQALRFALLIFAKRTGITAQVPAIQFDDTRRQTIQKAPVVRDEEQRDVTRQQQIFQPVDSRDVEVVGRLVEEEHIRFTDQTTRQGDPLLLTAGQPVDACIGVEVKLGDHAFGQCVLLPGVGAF